MSQPQQFEIEIAGKPLRFEVGRVANLSGGAVTVRYGDTVVLATACASRTARPGADFFPLTVDAEERMYAAGKIPGSFFRREGRPGTEAVLMARLTDRPLRPLFPRGFHNEVQVIETILSVDHENQPDILGIIGASTALTISDIPFDDPVGACRVGYLDGQFVVNPTYEQLQDSQLDLTVAGTGDAIMMVEAGGREVPESVLIDALRVAQEVNGRLVEKIREIQRAAGKKKWDVVQDAGRDAAVADARASLGTRVADALKLPGGKQARNERMQQLKDELLASLAEKHEEAALGAAFEHLEGEAVREAILSESRRPDGRALDELRPLSSELAYLPRAHGSAVFTRGETQVLSVVTLGSVGDHQKIDSLSPETEKYFMHHYNFPGFSTGEVRRMGTGRREIGHGALVERALKPVLPDMTTFPYTIRIVSDVLSSNGSSSMASVCGSTLALMDAGVPIKAPVAGIAMGLVTGTGGRAAVLTDIQGAEDHSGDMDFKVAGTAAGVTALQMDIKVKGITYAVMGEALEQARRARLEILEHMRRTIEQPRADLSKYAPRMLKIQIPVDKIGTVIGPGGKVIRGMIERWGVSIDIEDDGSVVVGSTDRDSAEAAISQIRAMTKEVEVGDRYRGRVTRIMPFGAMVEILPGKDGLVHVSEFSEERVDSVERFVKLGDELDVVVVEIDHLNRVNLSVKAARQDGSSPAPVAAGGGEAGPAVAQSPRYDRPRGGRDRRDRGGDRGDRGGRGDRGPRRHEGGRRDEGSWESRGGRPDRGESRGEGRTEGRTEDRGEGGGEGGNADRGEGRPRPPRRQVGGYGAGGEPLRPPRREDNE
jgi:polyribonucleotide nucleotidyltransferase